MFIDQLCSGIAETGGRVCVGLDPHMDRIPSQYGPDVAGVERFLQHVISETAPHAAVYKPNAAFFEAMGPEGLRLLRRVIDSVHRLDRSAILDAKRGDIASTAGAYARALLGEMAADAVTVVAYMGEEAVVPFLEAGGFAFVVAVPSNASARAIIEHGDPPLYLRIVEMACTLFERFPKQVGLVVGATQPDKVCRVRAGCPDLPWLVPGLGAQGGDAAAFFSALEGEQLFVANASRSILFADDPAAAACSMKHMIEELRHA